MSITFTGWTYNFPDDLDMILVSPTGKAFEFWSDAGGTGSGVFTTLTVADTGATLLPDNTTPASGSTYKPANYETCADPFVANAGLPATVFQPTGNGCGSATFTSVFHGLSGTELNGTWKLFIVDDSGDAGDAITSVSLDITAGGPTAADGTISGRITNPDGSPLGGVVMRLSGSQTNSTITDADGNYRFENVESNGFYTVTPERVNYAFSPSNISFSSLAIGTQAVFTAEPVAETANPLDTDMYFVRQQYLDFLGREPDHGGLLYWTNEMHNCTTEAGCARRRNEISAAFFKSAEFQETGSFVYRLYRAGLGREVGYTEFNADRQQVLAGGALDTRKEALSTAFVQRAEFASKYSQTNNAADFVDALLANVQQSAGVDLFSARNALISAYETGSNQTESRAAVLRDLADRAEIKQAVENSSFVLMEYFGYLRRDADEGGRLFWLNVLENKEPGNFLGMVCSFVTSAEYQQRFAGITTHSNRECK
ncbi:MAG TPA: DUF4214 domain-containing protein [Pyrinomonadaceae bacterium]